LPNRGGGGADLLAALARRPVCVGPPRLPVWEPREELRLAGSPPLFLREDGLDLVIGILESL
jgi:hypothetical protein